MFVISTCGSRSSSETASVYLKKLAEIGVLTEIARGKDKLFVHPKLITLMTTDADGFAEYR